MIMWLIILSSLSYLSLSGALLLLPRSSTSIFEHSYSASMADDYMTMERMQYYHE